MIRRAAVVPLLLAALAAPVARPAHAQSLKPGETLSSLTVTPTTLPRPVVGADGWTHLVYELVIANPTALFVTLDRVEAVTPEGASLGALEGEALAARIQRFGATGTRLAPGTTVTVLMDVVVPTSARLPEQIATRIGATREKADTDGRPTPLPADSPLPAQYGFTTAAFGIGPSAVVVDAPLRGPGWVAVNGCCDTITSHRGAILSVNGRLRVPERFAIDFVQLDAGNRLFTGEESALASYPYYGVPVYAVGAGTVVNLYDDADEQVPGAEAHGITPENIGGNMLVIDMGSGNFAFYAHLQRGSLMVKLGDKVTDGQVIGKLGNTGNSTAPHLHFHVMDSASPLDSDGRPFVFRRFTGAGVLAAGGEDAAMSGKVAEIDARRLAGPMHERLPLNDQVVDFGE